MQYKNTKNENLIFPRFISVTFSIQNVVAAVDFQSDGGVSILENIPNLYEMKLQNSTIFQNNII